MGRGQRQNCNNDSRSWVEDIYWTHFQFLHFAQFLPSGFHQHLALPKTFSDNIKKKLPENMSLKGPGGVVWNIGLTAKDDTLYFAHGWQQFVKDHSLKENDFLVFKYNGESLFEVLMFDGETFCEKAASYFVRQRGHAHPEQNGGGGCSSKRWDTDNSVEQVNTTSNGGVECVSPEKPVPLKNIEVPLDAPSETAYDNTSNAGVEPASPEQAMADAVTEDEPEAVPSQTTGKRTRRPVYDAIPIETKRRGRPPKPSNSLNWVAEDDEPPSGRAGSCGLYISNRRPVTGREIQNTLQRAQAACTHECLYVVMRPSHVYKRFYVSFSNNWMLKLISPKSQDVILRMDKGKWLVKYSYNNIRHNGGITGGWKYFALDSNLEEFDVCVFKPSGNMNDILVLDVSIFRVVEETIPPTAVSSPGKRRGRKKAVSAIEAETGTLLEENP